ncbi:MAG TPA: hypothetical protein VH209_00275 [Steroidobacteraceae bacterium]|nr:hypothetical protein [Steroidobacteraceae bacterium]
MPRAQSWCRPTPPAPGRLLTQGGVAVEEGSKGFEQPHPLFLIPVHPRQHHGHLLAPSGVEVEVEVGVGGEAGELVGG